MVGATNINAMMLVANSDVEHVADVKASLPEVERGVAGALAQVAAGLARVYADRRRDDRKGRLHRV